MRNTLIKLYFCLLLSPLMLVARQDTIQLKPDTTRNEQLNNDLNKVKQLSAKRFFRFAQEILSAGTGYQTWRKR